MKKKIINIVLLAATVAMTGCNDWLDMSPTNKVSEKIVWSDVNYVTQYVNGFYPYISRYGAFETGDSQVGLTDGLTETLKFGSATPGTNVGFANIIAFAEGGLAASTAAFHFGAWDDTYTRIRRVNEFLYGLKKYGSNFDGDTYKRFEAEARFFRGFLYFQLLKRTPEVILYNEDLLAITENKALSTGAHYFRCRVCDAVARDALCQTLAVGQNRGRRGIQTRLCVDAGQNGRRLRQGVYLDARR